MIDISDMTEAEVVAFIYKGKKVDELVLMPEEIAIQVIESDRFSSSMRDWAYSTLDE